MADEITLSSTTASQEEINQAMGIAPEPAAKSAAVAEADKTATEEQQKTEAEQKAKEHPQAKKPKSAQDRIDQLTKEKYELRERLARLEGAQGGDKKDAAEPAKAAADKKLSVVPTRVKPTKNDPKYKDYDEFTEDLAAWKAEQIIAADKAEAAQKATNDRLRERFDGFNAQIAEAKTHHEDWDEVAGDTSIVVPKIFDVAIPDFENGAEMLYYVGTHPEFRQKLLDMNDGFSDLKIVAELSRLSDFLADEAESAATAAKTTTAGATVPAEKTTAAAATTTAKPAVTSSTAPAPIKPVGGAGTVGAKKALDQADFQDYKRRRKAGEG